MKLSHKGNVTKKMWLLYFNRELFDQNVISLQEYHSMKRMIHLNCK